MEHRYGRRSDSSTSAGIYRSGERLGETRITNFSSTGMYLQPRLSELRPFQLIEIEVPDGRERRRLRLRAGVIRVDEHGVGVQLDAGHVSDAERLDAVLVRRDRGPVG